MPNDPIQELFIYRKMIGGRVVKVIINAERAWYMARLGVTVERIA